MMTIRPLLGTVTLLLFLQGVAGASGTWEVSQQGPLGVLLTFEGAGLPFAYGFELIVEDWRGATGSMVIEYRGGQAVHFSTMSLSPSATSVGAEGAHQSQQLHLPRDRILLSGQGSGTLPDRIAIIASATGEVTNSKIWVQLEPGSRVVASSFATQAGLDDLSSFQTDAGVEATVLNVGIQTAAQARRAFEIEDAFYGFSTVAGTGVGSSTLTVDYAGAEPHEARGADFVSAERGSYVFESNTISIGANGIQPYILYADLPAAP